MTRPVSFSTLVAVSAFSLAAVACDRREGSSIPPRDGPLQLEVRFPQDGTPVPAQDSIAIWGTVGTGTASLTANGRGVQVAPNGTFAAYLPIGEAVEPTLRLVARRGTDSTLRVISLSRSRNAVGPAEGALRPWRKWVTMHRLPSDTADEATQQRPIYSRWRPGGTVAIALPQGMRLLADARTDRSIRLRLAGDELVWIPLADADTTAAERTAVVTASAPVMQSGPLETRVAIRLPERMPSTVELQGNRLFWTIYGARWDTRPPSAAGDGRPVRHLAPHDSAQERVVVELELTAMPLGWKTEWQDGTLTLRIRPPLPVRADLRGLTVLLDPGHPPNGTVGPSGLMEDSVTLAVAQRVAALLRQRGATVLHTRSTAAPLSLEARALMAEQSDAHLFLSLHLNSPGPGRPPSAVDGTQTYFMQPNGRTLAAKLLGEVARAIKQSPMGSREEEFAVLRPAWMAGVLVEGSALVLPEREAFFRTPAGIEAYAIGVVNGIQLWLASADTRQFSPEMAR